MFDPQDVANIIIKIADNEILPRFRNLNEDEIKTKSHPGDLVTIADTEAEKALTTALSKLLPGSLVVGEEAVAADPNIMDILNEPNPVWILDPVDGTANFAHGHDLFGVIVALVQNKETIAGWIYDPLRQKMISAQKGCGAFNGNSRLSCTSPALLPQMRGYFGCSKTPALENSVSQNIVHGSAAHDYIALAEKRMDFAFYRRVKPWDHAAGVLIYQETGGIAQMIDKSPYHPGPNQEGLLLAPSFSLWNELQSLILSNYPQYT